MNAQKAKQEAQFTFYRPAPGNQLDLGFTLRGYRFRLVNPRKQERSLDRQWMPVTKNKLPEAFVRGLAEHRPGFWGEDGLHRVNNDLVLYYMTEEQYQEAAAYLAERNREEQLKLQGKRSHAHEVRTEGEYEDASEAFKQ